MSRNDVCNGSQHPVNDTAWSVGTTLPPGQREKAVTDRQAAINSNTSDISTLPWRKTRLWHKWKQTGGGPY